MTTQDGLISIDSENLRNRFKDIQKTRLAEGGSSGSNNGDEEKLEQELGLEVDPGGNRNIQMERTEA